MADGKTLPELEEALSLAWADQLLVNARGQPRRATVATLFATRGIISVNDFGAVGDGRSHRLAETYGNFAAAKRDYPAATSLLDEKDWCAWQAASDAAYAAGAARVWADGH